MVGGSLESVNNLRFGTGVELGREPCEELCMKEGSVEGVVMGIIRCYQREERSEFGDRETPLSKDVKFSSRKGRYF